MAQTTQKKRAAPKRSQGSQRSRGSGSRPTKTKAKAKASNGSSGTTAKSTDRAVGNAASKAKVPLIASGAALAGAAVAGGLALASNRRHRSRFAGIHKPLIKVDSRDVAKAAKGVGDFSSQIGELAAELQRNRENANGSKHRSPVEVVLQGLTSRR